MSEWKKVKIGEFLKQYRNTIYVDDAQQYRQVTISSKDGVKYRCTKIGKEIGRKRQFLIDLKKYPNTVIFTRQGLHEGSIGLAPEEVDSCIATENMPMFSVDDTVIDTQYLKNLLRSSIFANLVSTLTPTGSAQKSIHERDLLPLEISIPNLETQKKIVKDISSQLEKTEQLSFEIAKQKAYAKQLRQNILQEAIEGKLTADWRKQHPVQKGNPDYDAEALFDKIQAEMSEAKSTKKSLAPIAKDEIPFEIPTGWKWVRLGGICEGFMYGTSAKSLPYGKCPVLRMGNIQNGKIDWEKLVYTNNDEEMEKYLLKQYDLLFNRTNSREMVGKTAIFESTQKTIYAGYLVKFRPIKSNPYFVNIVLNSKTHREWCNEVKTDALGQSNINAEKLKNFITPLPPLAEQKEIVARVEQHLQTITQLETQIATRETTTKQLMQSILKDAFEEG
ncbi:restriction endonuclease subunit S [uncultured Fibrobacter sp.]|uniref:restriction endonuclease subunit S n=1 Tax=uncultured Fibrobacter sp. TaxID=261512 RepID=UPI0025DD20DF|nr:restriction endonuclease subunit S [uncultured Fibrobacter sp.]